MTIFQMYKLWLHQTLLDAMSSHSNDPWSWATRPCFKMFTHPWCKEANWTQLHFVVYQHQLESESCPDHQSVKLTRKRAWAVRDLCSTYASELGKPALDDDRGRLGIQNLDGWIKSDVRLSTKCLISRKLFARDANCRWGASKIEREAPVCRGSECGF